MKKVCLLLIGLLLIGSINVSAVHETPSASVEYLESINILSANEKQPAKVSRIDFAILLTKALRHKGIHSNVLEYIPSDAFTDINKDNEEQAESIRYLTALGVIFGDGQGNFHPNEPIRFCEAISMVIRSTVSYERIVDEYGGFPIGYIKLAADQGLTKGIAHKVDDNIDASIAAQIIVNTMDSIKSYDIMKPLNCDNYNGEIYVDYYPKKWQGFAKKPIATSNGFFNILPEKVLISSNGIEWETAYENIDGEMKYYFMPSDYEIDAYTYLKEHCAFIGTIHKGEHKNDIQNVCYSYNLKDWFPGTPEYEEHIPLPLNENKFPYGITKSMIVSDEAAGLYFAWIPYENTPYYSQMYSTELVQIKCKRVWISKDSITWIGLNLPVELEYYFPFTIKRRAQGIIVEGYKELSQEEQIYVNSLALEAEKQNKGYDKPQYIPFNYFISFEDMQNLFAVTK